jgi:hypothetical protein
MRGCAEARAAPPSVSFVALPLLVLLLGVTTLEPLNC